MRQVSGTAAKAGGLSLPHEALEVIEGRRRWAVIHGEALLLLLLMPDACIDAVIADQPYSSGGQFKGDRAKTTVSKYVLDRGQVMRPEFTGDNRDQRSFATWAALWLAQAHRVAKEGAPVVLATDWRQLPATTDALQAGGWIWRGIVPWDKTEGARPQKGRFMAQCEYWPWGSKGAMPEERGVGCLSGIVRQYPNPSEKNHIASKTPKVMAPLVEICEPGGLILDPFTGGASTGIAALASGRRFIGFELDDACFEEAKRTMQSFDAGLSAEQARGAAQGQLFGGLS